MRAAAISPTSCSSIPTTRTRAEDAGTSNDYHHRGSLLVAEEFVAQVYNALKDSPQWGRMVFVLNFDEHGGFFDHVSRPHAKTIRCRPVQAHFQI